MMTTKYSGAKTPGSKGSGSMLLDTQFDLDLSNKTRAFGLNDFESRLECEARQSAMLKRLTAAGIDPETSETLAACTAQPHGCRPRRWQLSPVAVSLSRTVQPRPGGHSA